MTRRLRSLGYALSDSTVQRWSERGNIPGEWFVPVARAAQADGIRHVDVLRLAQLVAHQPQQSRGSPS